MLVKIRKPRDRHEAILFRAVAFSRPGRNDKHPLMLSFLLFITFSISSGYRYTRHFS